MGFTSRSEYAILAVYELARLFPSGKTLSAQEIAKKYDLSGSFLIQTLRRLREAGLIEAARGSQGGYRLLYRPDDVALGYVVALVETPCSSVSTREESSLKRKVNAESFTIRDHKRDAVKVQKNLEIIWNHGESKRQEYFNGITFAKLLSMEDAAEEALSFTI